jgi:hypothetical protein
MTMMKPGVDDSYQALCGQLGLEPLTLEQWIEKLRAEGVTSVSIEIEAQQPDQHVVRAWNPKWLGGAAGTGRAATDVEAAARCWVAIRGPSWPSHG